MFSESLDAGYPLDVSMNTIVNATFYTHLIKDRSSFHLKTSQAQNCRWDYYYNYYQGNLYTGGRGWYRMCTCQPSMGLADFESWKIFFSEATANFSVDWQLHKRYHPLPPVKRFPWLLIFQNILLPMLSTIHGRSTPCPSAILNVFGWVRILGISKGGLSVYW